MGVGGCVCLAVVVFRNLQGIERFPMNLMEGTRSAWAAAWRKARVANILSVGVKVIVAA